MALELNQAEIKNIGNLLRHDLRVFGTELGLLNYAQPNLAEEIAVPALNIAERLSKPPVTDEGKNLCLLICGLLWEHKHESWHALSPFLMLILSRLGLMPSVKMVDPNYDSETEMFSSLGSILSDLAFVQRVVDNEVTVLDKTILLSAFQKNMWMAIDKYDRLGISAPTSAGKSFVLVKKIIDFIHKTDCAIVYIVPTITLINQVSSDLRKALKQYGINGINIAQTWSPKERNNRQKSVYVLTQERVLAAMSQNRQCFDDVKMLIVDEVQNIERVANEGNERSLDLYHVIQEFENNVAPQKIVVCGPRLNNIKKLVTDLFGEKAERVSEDTPPVLNLTYTFSQFNKKCFIKQYSTFSKNAIFEEIANYDCIDPKAFGKVRYDERLYQLIRNLTNKLNTGESGTIVFSPTKDQAAKTALAIGNDTSVGNRKKALALSQYIAETVHPAYSLVECVRNGTAFHHSGVPDHIRLVLEKAFSEQAIKTIVCTTTLMQGVNLPAKNIIARNPNLHTSREGEQLTAYEFANLRGRAGRLMKDFVGRTIVLDETAFEVSSMELHGFPAKEVNTGFGPRFENNGQTILEALLEGEAPNDTEGLTDYDIIVYVRQMVLRYGIGALSRLHKVRIPIQKMQLQRIYTQMQELSVPKEVCFRNLHWDPLVLERLHIEVKKNRIPKVPRNAFESNFVNRMTAILATYKSLIPYYSNKYFPYEGKILYKILRCAQGWAQEKSLINITNWRGAETTSEDVKDTLALLNNTIAYNLPKLLRPLLHLQDDTNPILNFLEMGTYKPETRRLMELGLPREMAVRLIELMGKDGIRIDADSSDDALLRALRKEFKYLNYWEQRVVEDYI